MTITLKKTDSIAELNRKLKKRKLRKPFNAKKYLGKLKRGLDGLEYQKKLRDEWE